ncbi:MAG: GFA family protein [Alphaproteobacteria bacterium]|nr:GFA family protein [Alphaproteobacteria bacterium]
MSDPSRSPARRTGGCACGAVRFEVDGPLKQIVACHCTMCRRQTGHFLASTDAWKDQMGLTGEAAVVWRRSSEGARRGFCGTCGSFLFFDVIGAETISIAAGALDDASGLEIAAHVFTADKGAYYEILDDAPHFPLGGSTVPMPPRDADG